VADHLPYLANWRDDGTFQTVQDFLQPELLALEKLQNDLWSVDGPNIRASREPVGGGRGNGLKNHRTTLLAGLAADSARRCTCWCDGGHPKGTHEGGPKGTLLGGPMGTPRGASMGTR
jgi:hypothetical protein